MLREVVEFGRLDVTLTPGENAALGCEGPLGEGLVVLDYFPPATSCSGGEYSVFAGVGGNAVIVNTAPTSVIVCPGEGELAILLGAWGAGGPVVHVTGTSGAYVDLDNDGSVGASDLAALLASWSTP